MKERPILFQGDMVRAILARIKAQTRRVIKPQPQHERQPDSTKECEHREWMWRGKQLHPILCPYGRAGSRIYDGPGDRLWVRETFADIVGTVVYRADNCRERPITPSNWTPSIFMPRKLSRILLEITDVRVQRVREISEEDAEAEGISLDTPAAFPCPECCGEGVHPALGANLGVTEVDCEYCNTAKKRYKILWDSINAKRGYGWDVNPWVWAITFKEVKPCS